MTQPPVFLFTIALILVVAFLSSLFAVAHAETITISPSASITLAWNNASNGAIILATQKLDSDTILVN